MPELLVMRHAKSDWRANAQDDRLRPLNTRGVQAAQAVGQILRLARRIPDLVLTSPAVRAATTVDMAVEAGEWGSLVETADILYGASPGHVIDLLRGVEEAERVAVVGHEPTSSALVSVLVGGGAVRMPTAAVASIEVPVWPGVGPGCGRLNWLLIPRLFTDGDFDLSGPELP